jgi:hypothetical protein
MKWGVKYKHRFFFSMVVLVASFLLLTLRVCKYTAQILKLYLAANPVGLFPVFGKARELPDKYLYLQEKGICKVCINSLACRVDN